MEINTKIIDPIFDRFEKYASTSIDLYQLKAIGKSSEIATHILLKSINAFLFLLFAIPLNIAAALYLGELVGEMYIGFLCLSGFYFISWLVFRVLKKVFRNSINNRIINKLIESTWKK
jgi:hypothetical protein